MDSKLLLVKSITLLYRESQMSAGSDNSNDLVRNVIEDVKVGDVGIGINSDREIIIALKETAMEMCGNPPDHVYDKKQLLQRIKLNTGNDDKLYDIFEGGIEEDLPTESLKRSVLNLRKSINNHFREQQINEVLNKAAYSFKFQRDKIKDVNQFVAEVLGQLEPLQIVSDAKDPAVVSDIDIGDVASMHAVFNDVKNANNGDGILRTGWQDLNDMLQGGFRRGEFTMIGALQHKYKTGFSLSLFKQLAIYNKPYMLDPTKKPLLLRISFEDDINLNLQFLYQSLKYTETRERVDVSSLTVEEMAAYVRDGLSINGYHVKLLRVDPSQWTYRHICNKIIELEAQGYEIHAMMLDYLGMVPTTGCITSGPSGTDMRDLFRRVRNFCGGNRKIAVITPHQLSTEAKALIRGGVAEDKFVCEINEKGYYAGSKQLDQECDLILLIHLFKHNRETYFSIQRDKHRLPTILPDEKKYMLLKFPKNGMPIPDDLNGEISSFRKLPLTNGNTPDTDRIFDF